MAGSTSNFRRLVDGISRNEVLVPLIETALLSDARSAWPVEYPIRVTNKERVDDGYFHPSSDAGADALFLYYKFAPFHHLDAERIPPELLLTFQVGAAYHALLQSILVNAGLVDEQECEVPFTNHERRCSGTVDVRRVKMPDGTTPPVEIKSAAWMPKEPYANHVAQLQVYMDLGCETPQDYGLILYMQKQHPHALREFRVERDEELLRAIYGKWAAVLEAIEFRDPSGLADCEGCYPNSKVHLKCPARKVCRMGPPSPLLGS